jgi:hypothetical protein
LLKKVRQRRDGGLRRPARRHRLTYLNADAAPTWVLLAHLAD